MVCFILNQQWLLADIENAVVLKDTDNDFRMVLSALTGELNADEGSLAVNVLGAAAGFTSYGCRLSGSRRPNSFCSESPTVHLFQMNGSIWCSCLTFTGGLLRKEK